MRKEIVDEKNFGSEKEEMAITMENLNNQWMAPVFVLEQGGKYNSKSGAKFGVVGYFDAVNNAKCQPN